MDFLTDIFGGPMGLNLFGLGSVTSGAGSLFNDMAVPGMPTTIPPSPSGLLRAGDDDMRPPPMASSPFQLQKAGLEPTSMPRAPLSPVGQNLATDRGVTIVDPETTGAVAGQANPPPITLPPPAGATTSIPKPPGSPGGRVVESTAGTPPGGAPPKIDIAASTAGGTAVPAQGAPPTAPVGDPAKSTEASPTAMQNFRDMLSKMPNLQAAQAQQAKGAALGGMQGDPAAASRQGASQLFQSIMEAHLKSMPQMRGVPQMPASLLRRMPQMSGG